MSDWFAQLKSLLGVASSPKARRKGKDVTPKSSEKIEPSDRKLSATETPERTRRAVSPQSGNGGTSARSGRRLGYLLVVGFDFGTAFTKCVIRDANVRDPGRAHPVRFKLADGWSYLVPSLVYMDGTTPRSAFDTPADSKLPRIDHLKMRLVASADPARAHAWGMKAAELNEAKALSAWFVAHVLAHVGREILTIWSDFGERPDDACFVNICVPISNADAHHVETAFSEALCAAWNTVGRGGVTPPSIERIREVLAKKESLNEAKDFCYTYPETSANLQTYLRSRARLPGLYLLIDVGAGTMDLSFFILHSDAGVEKPLIYLHGSVLEVGSSRIEIEVLKRNPKLPLEEVVAHKEGRATPKDSLIIHELDLVRKKLRSEVATGVGRGVSDAEARINEDLRAAQRQMKGLSLLFAGGGFCHDPYEQGARFFHRHRQWPHEPPGRELPDASDLKWGETAQVPFKRLSVAYGLSFPRFELENHKFPSEVRPVARLIDEEPPDRPYAPTKDDV